jgi:hypothetical protein
LYLNGLTCPRLRKGNGGPETQEKLWENEKLMREMSLTWQEKLHKTEQLQVVYSSTD